jgi:hypothetical protein
VEVGPDFFNILDLDEIADHVVASISLTGFGVNVFNRRLGS